MEIFEWRSLSGDRWEEIVGWRSVGGDRWVETFEWRSWVEIVWLK